MEIFTRHKTLALINFFCQTLSTKNCVIRYRSLDKNSLLLCIYSEHCFGLLKGSGLLGSWVVIDQQPDSITNATCVFYAKPLT